MTTPSSAKYSPLRSFFIGQTGESLLVQSLDCMLAQQNSSPEYHNDLPCRSASMGPCITYCSEGNISLSSLTSLLQFESSALSVVTIWRAQLIVWPRSKIRLRISLFLSKLTMYVVLPPNDLVLNFLFFGECLCKQSTDCRLELISQ
jgi:hypothetical protein